MTLLVGSIFHMTRKIVSEMTYNVSMGTLNPTIPYHLDCFEFNYIIFVYGIPNSRRIFKNRSHKRTKVASSSFIKSRAWFFCVKGKLSFHLHDEGDHDDGHTTHTQPASAQLIRFGSNSTESLRILKGGSTSAFRRTSERSHRPLCCARFSFIRYSQSIYSYSSRSGERINL